MSITCKRCAVWKQAEDVSFATVRSALEHLIACHPNKLTERLMQWENFNVEKTVRELLETDDRQ